MQLIYKKNKLIITNLFLDHKILLKIPQLQSILVRWFLECQHSLLPFPVWPLPICPNIPGSYAILLFGRPGVLWFLRLQRVRQDWTTELTNWTDYLNH